MKLNLANKLTIFRIVLVILMVIISYIPVNGQVLNIRNRYVDN